MERTVIAVGGPNGAGKTTFARQLLLEHLPDDFSFLNADLIAEGISPFKPHKAATRAGKDFLRRFDDLARRGASFVVESTFSGLTMANRLQRLSADGYRVEIVYLWLPTAEMAVARVAERIKQGGHAIPVDTIRRRFGRSYPNFCTAYQGVADYWKLLDGSATPPAEVASGGKERSIQIFDKERFALVGDDIPGGGSAVEEVQGSYPEKSGFYLEDLDEVLEAVDRFLRDLEGLAPVY